MINVMIFNYPGEKTLVDKSRYLWGDDDNPINATNILQGDFRTGEVDVENPEIIVEDSADTSTLTDYDPTVFGKASNYVYIPELGRYYFIVGKYAMNTERGRTLWRLKLHVDGLMTYRESIYKLTARVERSEIGGSGSAAYLPDDNRSIRTDKQLEIFTPTQADVFKGHDGGGQTAPFYVMCNAGRRLQ